MPKGFSANQSQIIKQKLIHYAMSLAGEAGIRKTTINQLSQAANISAGAFYNFFPSKEALFFNVYEILENQIKEEFLQHLEEESEINFQTIKAIIQHLLSSDKMQNLLTIMRKNDLDFILLNIEPDIVKNHLEEDKLFINSIIEKLHSFGLGSQLNSELILSYTQALFNLSYERDQFQPNSERILNTFINAMLEDLLFEPTREK